MAAKRRLGITKRVSLADIADDWDDSCYAVITKVTNREHFELSDLDTGKLNERQAIELQAKFVREHFVSGQVKIVNGSGEFEIAPMDASDIDDNTDIASCLFLACVGSDLDPKDIPKVVKPAGGLPKDAATTETISSTA